MISYGIQALKKAFIQTRWSFFELNELGEPFIPADMYSGKRDSFQHVGREIWYAFVKTRFGIDLAKENAPSDEIDLATLYDVPDTRAKHWVYFYIARASKKGEWVSDKEILERIKRYPKTARAQVSDWERAIKTSITQISNYAATPESQFRFMSKVDDGVYFYRVEADMTTIEQDEGVLTDEAGTRFEVILREAATYPAVYTPYELLCYRWERVSVMLKEVASHPGLTRFGLEVKGEKPLNHNSQAVLSLVRATRPHEPLVLVQADYMRYPMGDYMKVQSAPTGASEVGQVMRNNELYKSIVADAEYKYKHLLWLQK